MLPILRARTAWLPLTILALSGLGATSCSREAAAPAGAITGAMAPVAAVGSLLRVTATSADKQAYTVTADAHTGAFNFGALPPGVYTLAFTTTTADPFPRTVRATVRAGATATPAIPPITHDGVGRGTMKWVVDGQPYAATAFIKLSGDGASFDLWGRSGSFSTGPQVSDVQLTLPQDFGQSKYFTGAGTYVLGEPSGVPGTPLFYASCVVYPGNSPYQSVRYTSVGGPAVGTLRLLRYDAQQGTATGTFDYRAAGVSGATNSNTPTQIAVTGGEFDITF